MPKDISTYFPLREGRCHEVCGTGTYFFACVSGAMSRGHAIWVREEWRKDMINPLGVSVFFDPANLLMALAKDQTEVLAVAEESLRSGAVPLVILEVTRALDLKAGRRLQLAARDGKATALVIIPEGMGSNATETRWRCNPCYDAEAPSGDSTLQKWELIKNKTGTLGTWNVRWDAKARRVIVVSPTGERPGAQGAPD